MITKEQQRRALVEFTEAASKAFAAAAVAERELEFYTYSVRPYDPAVREAHLSAFKEADYQAESRAWIANLIRAAIDPIEPLRDIDPVLAHFEQGVRDGLAKADAIAAKLEDADHICVGQPPF